MNTVATPNTPLLDLENLRKDFPILATKVHAKPLIYLDNGATAQKPKQVLDAIQHYYQASNANVHRGVHQLSQQATSLFDKARQTVQKHLNAAKQEEIIFTKGTTESLCLLAATFENSFIKKGDEIIVSEMEHHSNIVPWQVLAQKVGALLKVLPVSDAGEISLESFKRTINPKSKLLAITHVSNTLGSINPIQEMCNIAHQNKVLVVVDGAQAVPHMQVDVQQLDCDFYVYSGHKLFGPTGIGILYGKEALLKSLPPYQTGGGMIKTVSFDKTEYAELPQKFEAGTPNIEGAIGLASAIDYVNTIGFELIQRYEHDLLNYATIQLQAIEGLKIIGNAQNKASVISFVIEGLHPFDVGTILDQQGVAVRTGHHCTQPLMQRYGIPGTIRASFAFYNTFEEIDALVKAVKKAIKMLK
ncbi:MAG TPA: cysteine desulfurase [Bacteroidia bacterium]|nr:cysteine desulfurase [Bacteroidia bacterium]HRH06995.1 cysteine desulfurase [Bacteroidia bacterium]HRH63022.1 cysteine desulfurase [Bacteroidia bacterium]